MAKVTIKFDLGKDNDLRDYNLFNNSNGMYDSLFEISKNLKKKVEFQMEEDDNGALDLVFNIISNILEENNVIIDRLE